MSFHRKRGLSRRLDEKGVNMKTSPPALSIPGLRADVKGRVIGPDDDGYDEARTLFYGGFDRRPSAIVRVANTDDVSQVVSLAGETGLELAVRSGGHNPAGHSGRDGGGGLHLPGMK